MKLTEAQRTGHLALMVSVTNVADNERLIQDAKQKLWRRLEAMLAEVGEDGRTYVMSFRLSTEDEADFWGTLPAAPTRELGGRIEVRLKCVIALQNLYDVEVGEHAVPHAISAPPGEETVFLGSKTFRRDCGLWKRTA